MKTESRSATLVELLQLAREQNLEVNERTFHYYVSRGLLPKGSKLPQEGADGRVNYWPLSVLKKLRRILRLKHQGFKLEQIRQALQAGQRVSEAEPSDNWRREVALRYLRNFRSGRLEAALADLEGRLPAGQDTAAWLEFYKDCQRQSLSVLIGEEAAQRWVQEYFLGISAGDLQRALKQFRSGLPRRPSSAWLKSGQLVRRAVSQFLLGALDEAALRDYLGAFRQAFQQTAAQLPRLPGATQAAVAQALQECLDSLATLHAGGCADWKEPVNAYVAAMERLHTCWEVEDRLRQLA